MNSNNQPSVSTRN